ncbi:phage tail tape measure protein [Anaerovoracaceae bacterium 41-7]|uniref:phage tail tape measure protein n=1 Tax=Emergencia sp. JLR.KK010 TaxID=3114296 RepID=UPI0030D2EC95
MASKKIRGITVEIGGDTSKLGDALKSVEQKTKNLQQELKGVNTLLKMDPGNIDLLRQKQTLLTQAVAETKSKLDTLKEAEKQAQEQFQRGDISEEQYRDLQREIVLTEQKLKSLTEQQKEFGSVGAQQIAAVGEKMQVTGEKIASAGKKLLPATAAIGGIGAASVKVSAEFEASMSQVAATMGMTAEEINNGSEDYKKLEQAARDMGASTKYSASEAAEALNYLALAGYDVDKSIETLPVVLNLAAAGGIELGAASDMVTDAMSALGLETDQAESFVDQMAKTSQKSNTNVAQLGEAILTVGGTAKNLAGGTVELNTNLGILADNGIKGAEGGTKLRNIILSLTAPTDKAAGQMKKLGLEVFDAEGNMRPLNETMGDLDKILSTMSQGEQTQVLNTIFNKQDLKGVNALLANSGERFDELSSYIGNADGAAQDMADTMNNNLSGQLTLLKSALQEAGISIGEALVPIIKDLVGFIQNLVDRFNALSPTAQRIIIIIGGIVAALAPTLIVIGKLITSVGTIMTVVPKLVTAFGAVKAAFASLGATLLANPIVLIVAGITALVAALIYAYKHSEKFRDAVNNAFARVRETVGTIVNALVTFFTETIPNAWNGFIDWCNNFIGSIIGFFANLPERIWNHLLETIANITKWTTNMNQKAREGVSKAISSIVGYFVNLPGRIRANLTKVIENVISWGTNLAAKGKASAKKLTDAVIAGIKSLPTKIKSVGKEIVTGLWNGITNKVDWIKEKITGFAGGILKSVKKALDINSPSRKMEKQVGEQIVAGIIKGVNNKKANAEKSASELALLYVSEAKKRAEEMKKVNDMTLADEIAYWEIVRSHLTKGTKAYRQATNQMRQAKQELNKELKKLNEAYKTDTQKIQQQLEKDIQAVTDAYNKAVEDRQKQILQSLNLFDAFSAAESADKNTLTANLQSQVDALKEWDAVLDDLAARDGMDSNLLGDLEGMGVSSINTLKEINSMTDEELSAYIALYNEKKQIALERSEAENEALRIESEKQIKKLITQAEKDLKKLKSTYESEIKKLGVDTKKSAKGVGADIVKGIISGIDSQISALKAKMKEVGKIATKTTQKDLEIKSPSRVFAREVGRQIPAGIALGVVQGTPQLTDALAQMNSETLNSATLDRQLVTTFDTPVGGNDSGGLLAKLDRLLERMSRLQIVLDTGVLVGETIDKIDAGLANKQALNARGI